MDLLGRGGMATVYKGYQSDIDRYVAVKVLPQLPEQDQAFVERFKLEARTIARLQHPHILPIYDFGDEAGLLYLVTAYAPGGSLNEQILKGPLPLATVDRLLREIAPALDYAHRQGIIHRDIKPANILLDREGNALLADFGIVKLLEGTSVSNLTGTSGIVGTPAYMSPEQANGQPVDGRTDVYALGVVMYEMLTGRQPFSAETPLQLLLKHLNEPPPLLRDQMKDLPPALDIVLQRALAKDPADRYQTAAQFAQAFAQAISNAETGTLQFPTGGLKPPTQTVPTAGNVPMTSVVTGNNTQPAPAATLSPVPQRSQALLPTLLIAGAAVLALVLALFALVSSNQRTPEVVVATATAVAPPTTVPVVIAPTSPPVPTFGSASFTTADALGDTLNLRVQNLMPPSSGARYVAWLQNTSTDNTLKLGDLEVDALGSGILSYTDESGMALPALYNRLILTLETEDTDTPSDTTRFIGEVPAAVNAALSEILIASEDGLNGDSLLDGALTEAGIGRQHTALAAAASNINGLHQHAEHSVNIFLGMQEDLDGNGRGENPGRGVGVAFFLEQIEAQLMLILEDETTDDYLLTQVEYIRVCLLNARNWMEEVVALEREFLAADTLEAVAADLSRSTDAAVAISDGVDLNQNGVVELFEGECGLQQVGESGILIGNLTLRAAEDA
jgi:serine/threonine protein kinase